MSKRNLHDRPTAMFGWPITSADRMAESGKSILNRP
jgi:hypothetical protein